MKIISNRSIRYVYTSLFLFLFFSFSVGAANAQTAGNANMKYIAIKADGNNYLFDQFPSFSSIQTPAAKEAEAVQNSGGYFKIKGLTSDGERWYSILKSPMQNCFTTYTSYKNAQALQGELHRCVDGYDGYRGLAYDGKLFYSLYWDGSKNIWQTYLTWTDVINNMPNSKISSTKHGDIYKSIAYDPVQRVFFSMAQSEGGVYIFKYATFNDMVAVVAANESISFASSETYAGMAIGPVNETLDIYIVAGQSNAVGWLSDGAWLQSDSADANIKFFYREGAGLDQAPSTSGSVTTLGPQTATFRGANGPATNFGIEMGIGRSLSASGRRNIAVVKVAYGGTTLASDWNMVSNPNGLFSVLQTQLANASKQWNQAGYRTRIAGFFWMQGEYDALNTSDANAYFGNLNSLKSTVRAISGNNYLPFVIGRIRTNWTYASTVRAAQAQLAAEDAYVRMVDTDDLPLYPTDASHFSSQGTYTLGQRMSDAYRSVSGW